MDSYAISLESFRSFIGPQFRKPVTGQDFFAVSYSKPALVCRSTNPTTNFYKSYNQIVMDKQKRSKSIGRDKVLKKAVEAFNIASDSNLNTIIPFMI